MPDDRLGLPERAALLALMAVGGEASNPELTERAGFTLVGRPRTRLNQLGLVDSRREGRAFRHELTDRGWRWCTEELSAPCPPRPGGGQGALYAVLAGLRRYLDRSGRSLAEVFGDLAEDPLTRGTGAATADGATPAGRLSDAEVITRVRTAYHRLAGGPGDWVSLTDLRKWLDGVPADRVDAALRQLSRQRQANLAPQANQKLLTSADRQAAVRIGVEDCHQVSMGAW